MKPPAARLALAALIAVALGGCPESVPTDGGATDAGATDAGSSQGPDAGAVGDLLQGDACLVGNDLCGAGLICSRIFDAPEAVGPRCWPRCEGAGTCTGVRGLEGDCRLSTDGASICVTAAGNLEACGDAAAATCAEGQLCVFAADALVGHCVTPCAPSDPTTCAQVRDDIDCGCEAALDCSIEGIRLADPTAPDDPDAADGVCVPPTAIGDGCGVDAETAAVTQCSPGQRCDAPDGGPGTCAAL